MLNIYVDLLTVSEAPLVKLQSGLNVVNFGSPHPFDFEDGSILPAARPDRGKLSMLDTEDVETATVLQSGRSVIIVKKVFKLTEAIREELKTLEANDQVDIVLIPYPLLACLQATGDTEIFKKCATVFVVDRTSKKISTQRYCR